MTVENTLYDVMVYPYHFKSKREAQQKTGMIKNNILRHPMSMTVEEIAQTCISGQPIAFCHAEGQSKNPTCKKSFTADTWKYQQIYALDFDNANRGHKFERPYYMEYSEAIEHAKKQGFSPAFAYTTGSHTETHHKFRLVFVLDRAVDSVLEHQKVQRAFLALFSIDGETVLDSSCVDPARLFYAGQQIVYTDYPATISVDGLLEKHSLPTCQHGKVEIDPPDFEDEIEVFPVDIQDIVEGIKKEQNDRNECSKSLRSRINTGLNRNADQTTLDNIYFQLSRPGGKFPTKPHYMRTCEDFNAFCSQINIADLLNLPEKVSFRCILPKHKDGKPSANIWKTDNGYVYKCHGCGSTYRIYELLEELSGCGRIAVMDWLAHHFNISYETDWQRYKKEEVLAYHDYVVTELKDDYPALYDKLVKSKTVNFLLLFLTLARKYLLDTEITGSDKVLFAQSVSRFAKYADAYGVSSAHKTIRDKLIYLAHLGLIEVLEDEQVPRYTMQYLIAFKQKHGLKMRTSCYAVPPLSHNLFDSAQQVVLSDKENSVRKTYMCREQIIRTSGQDEADNIYVQSKALERNPEAEVFYKRYKAATEKLLEKKGWTVEEEILNRLKGFTKQEKKKWSGICLPQLLAELELQRVPFTKTIEEEYNVKQTRSVKLKYGASRIIIPA